MKSHIKQPNDIKLSSSTLKLHLIPLSWWHFRPALLFESAFFQFDAVCIMDFLSIICRKSGICRRNVSNPRWIGIRIGILFWNGFHGSFDGTFFPRYWWSTSGLATDNLFWLSYNSIIIIKTIRIKLVSCAHNSWIFIMWQSGACALYVENTDDGCHLGAFAIFFFLILSFLLYLCPGPSYKLTKLQF